MQGLKLGISRVAGDFISLSLARSLSLSSYLSLARALSLHLYLFRTLSLARRHLESGSAVGVCLALRPRDATYALSGFATDAVSAVSGCYRRVWVCKCCHLESGGTAGVCLALSHPLVGTSRVLESGCLRCRV